jgi:predicted ATPase/class 3 adenylate cyclase/tRNA A-37 threonylcarbamoyl transferase component Bud32
MLTISGYEIFTLLHEGEHSQVYRGSRRADGKAVVLKTLHRSIPDPEQIARYRQEYAITQALQQVPGVIRTYGLEQAAHRPVIVLEDYGAQTLGEHLDQQPLAVEVFLQQAIALATILGEVHQAHVIHKDINPANILIHPLTHEIRLIDFGLASQLSRETPTVSGVGRLEGTLPYLSPEQTGRMNRALDYRSDFYSLGATFFEMLTGQPPFQFQDPLELIHAHIARTPPHLSTLRPGVPAAIAAIVHKLLEKRAEDRYQSARGLIADLQHCQTLGGQSQGLVFDLGCQDISDRFQIPQKLYGRSGEVAQMLAAFERVNPLELADGRPRGMRELVLVSGYSGIGKSVLVQEVYRPITGRRGYLIGGKFDALQRNVPYRAFINAFSDLMAQILTETDAQLDRWRARLHQHLGGNLPVLTALVPSLSLVVGEQPPPVPVPGAEAQNRILLALQSLVRVFAQPHHPLVIFLDDLQWADAASLKLMQRLLTEPDAHSLLLIGAYRDNEVGATHPLTLTLAQLKQAGGVYETVQLQPLALAEIAELVGDTLHCDQAAAVPLATLLQTKTGGNPFFLGEFLRTLYRDRLITFNGEQGQWQWDLSAIQQRNVTDNLVDMLATGLQQLPLASQRVLQYAACMGTPFDLRSLAQVLEQPLTLTAEQLWEALQAEVVLPVGETYRLTSVASLSDRPLRYRFAHDRIQQAAYSLLPQAERVAVHYRVGRRLLELASQEQETDRLFQIVNQLNLGQVEASEEQVILVGLNLRAGRQAKASAAYDTALTYLQRALELLGCQGWHEHPRLAADLHQEAAEVACLCGQYPLMSELTAEALAHVWTLEQRTALHLIQLQATILQNQPYQAVHQALPLLQPLGMRFPRRWRMAYVITGLMATRLRLMGWSDQALRSLPAMTDPQRLAVMALLERIGTSAYVATPDLSPLITFRILQWSLRYGYAAPTPMAFASYGLVMAGIMGDIKTGYRYGQMAVQMADRFESPMIRCRTQFLVNYLVNHWQESLAEIAPRMEDIYQLGLAAGDLEYGAFALYTAVQLRLLAGEPLPDMAQRLADSAETIERLQQQTALKWIRTTQDLVASLTASLADDSSPEVKVAVADADADGDRTGAFLASTYRLRLYYLFGQPDQALVEAERAQPFLDSAVSAPTMAVHTLFLALSQVAHWPHARPGQQRRYGRFIRQAQRQFRRWATHAPENYAVGRWLLAAEVARHRGRLSVALRAFQKALNLSQTHRRLPDEALVHERMGALYLQLNQPVAAAAHLNRAYRCYQLWGATTKALLLHCQYPYLIDVSSDGSLSKRVTTHQSTTGTTGHLIEALDFSSVMKASEAIAREIELAPLVTRLMEILLESAGAECGVLLVNQQGTLQAAASGAITQGTTAIQPQQLGEAAPSWPLAIVQYVMRTQQSLVLANASQDVRFGQDAYIQARQPQSVLCAPLKKQGRLTGLVYLENNLMANAFTPDRLEVINLLSAQAAIALDNACLYTDVAELNKAYARFVPRQFLQHLNKSSITEVNLGDQVQVEMSVMFADIRAFTTLSETLTPQANFEFINDYLACMEPIIVEHGGFIDKYIGDAIMALFSGPADDAVRAGIAMQQALMTYNARRQRQGQSPIRIGIGVNTGSLMLGTVGGPNRMDGTVISDAVNLSARLEELTKTYSTAFLIGHPTYQRLRYPQHHCIRKIGQATVKGKRQLITVYEVFDGDPDSLKQGKLATLTEFQQGVEQYDSGNPHLALTHFERCHEVAPLDPVTRYYLHRCRNPSPDREANLSGLLDPEPASNGYPDAMLP